MSSLEARLEGQLKLVFQDGLHHFFSFIPFFPGLLRDTVDSDIVSATLVLKISCLIALLLDGRLNGAQIFRRRAQSLLVSFNERLALVEFLLRELETCFKFDQGLLAGFVYKKVNSLQ